MCTNVQNEKKILQNYPQNTSNRGANKLVITISVSLNLYLVLKIIFTVFILFNQLYQNILLEEEKNVMILYDKII